MKLTHGLLFLTGTLIISVLSACNRESALTAVETFPVISPIEKDTVQQHEYVAEINAIQYVEIRSRVKGYIEKVHVDEGQVVKKDQPLFSISNKKFEQELQKAEAILKTAIAELKTAEVELTNTKMLAEKNIVSSTALELSKVQVDAMKARVEEAEAMRADAATYLALATIRAPFGGVINRIPYKVGSIVEEGGMLTTLSDNSEVFAYFNLSETDYLDYQQNSSGANKSTLVNLMLSNNTVYTHKGKIEAIESEIDATTGNIAFRARFPNPEQLLKHGASGKVIVQQALTNTLMIPQQSTFEIQDQVYVFVVTKDSTLRQRNIVPKMRIPHYFLVESGLSPDERILFEGVQGVRDGDKIIPAPVHSPLRTIANTEN